MGAQAVLVPAQLTVTPGGEVVAEITVTNSGRVVDSFALEILGPAAQWTRCEPETVSVFPGQSAVAHVVFGPPVDGSVPAGPLTFGVHVRSHEDPSGSVVAEGVLDVEAVTALTAELSPRTDRARGRWRSKHQVAIDNRGNAAATVEVVGFDEQDILEVTASPQQQDVAAGSAAFVTVRAKARHRFWKGPGQTKPFAVEVRSPSATPIRLNGTLLNEAVLPAWLPKAIAGVLVGAGVLAVLWFAAFKPTIKDTASNAANDQVKVVLSQAGVATNGNANGGGGAGGGGNAGQPATPTQVTPTSGTPSPPPPNKPSKPSKPSNKKPLPAPADFSTILTSTNRNLPADGKHQLQLTDLLLTNPNGDRGIISITMGGRMVYPPMQLIDFPMWDFHVQTPIIVPSGQTFTLNVTCQNPGNKACAPYVFVSGVSYTIGL
jgi:hypothetical protein